MAENLSKILQWKGKLLRLVLQIGSLEWQKVAACQAGL